MSVYLYARNIYTKIITESRMSGEFSWAQDASLRYGLQLYYNIEYRQWPGDYVLYTFYRFSIVFKRRICSARTARLLLFFLLNSPSSCSISLSLFFTPVSWDIDSIGIRFIFLIFILYR